MDELRSSLTRARELAEERSWIELARLAETANPAELETVAELSYLVADALNRTGRPARALPLARMAERAAAVRADERLHLRTINLLGIIAFEVGDVEAAGVRFSDLLERAEGRDDEFAARASNNLGIIANLQDRRDVAITSYERALAAYHRIGYTRGLAQTCYNLGISFRDSGRADEADKQFSRAMRHASDSASEDVLALAETERALLRAHAGDGALAESLGARALQRMERLGDPRGAANAVRVLAAAARAQGDQAVAINRLDQALETTAAYPDALLRAEIQLDRGALLNEIGDVDGAREALREAAKVFGDLGAGSAAEAARALLASIPTGPNEV